MISVISHVRPKQLVELVARARSGERSVIMEYSRYENLNRLMGVEANPIPVKMAMYAMGLIASPELRLPLVKMSNANAAHLKQEMKTLGII